MVIRIIQNDCHQWISDNFRVQRIYFRLGLRPGPNWGSYSAPSEPLAGLRGPTSKGEGRGGRGKRERKEERKGTGVTASPLPPDISLSLNPTTYGLQQSRLISRITMQLLNIVYFKPSDYRCGWTIRSSSYSTTDCNCNTLLIPVRPCLLPNIQNDGQWPEGWW